MRKSPIQLSIPTPCSEAWQRMSPTDDGRYCQHCQKEVIDFTEMTDQELVSYLQQSNGQVCGRVQEGQLDRVIMPVGERSGAFFPGALLASLLAFFHPERGKGQAVADTVLVDSLKPQPLPKGVLEGVVMNAVTLEPIPSVTILLGNTQYGMYTNQYGAFRYVSQSLPDTTFDIKFTVMGYEGQVVTYNKDSVNYPIMIYLVPASLNMPELVITPHKSWLDRTYVGLLFVKMKRVGWYQRFLNHFRKKSKRRYEHSVPLTSEEYRQAREGYIRLHEKDPM